MSKIQHNYKYINAKYQRFIILWLLLLIGVYPLQAQRDDKHVHELNLVDCINYALMNVIELQQRHLDYQITTSKLANQLTEYLPRLNFQIEYQHTLQRRRAIVGNQQIFFGPKNNNDFIFNLQQPIFSANLYHGLISIAPSHQLAKEEITQERIRIILQVSYAFYDVLHSLGKIHVLEGDLLRLRQSFLDAEHRYKVGATDKLDYLRARITLNNKQAAIQQAENNLRSSYAVLKNAIGMPNNEKLKLHYDSLALQQEIATVNHETPHAEERSEYKLLLLQQRLAQQNILFHNLNFLPTLTANAGYTMIFQENNNILKSMYQTLIPYSYVGLQLNWSLFNGLKKGRNLQQAKLSLRRTQLDLQQFQLNQNTEYTRAMSQYNSDLMAYQTLKENLEISQQVYNTVRNQYLSGIKTYLEVIVAESELSELRSLYLTALFQLLKDKVELDRTLGKIK